MLRKETVEKGLLDLTKRLMADEQFNDFNLVGGTALALKTGHRKSIDIDLFTTKDFNERAIADHLTAKYNPESLQVTKNGVACFINDIKVDILAHQYPLVKNVETVEGIRLISLEDIGAMKLNSIYNDGTRLKDFVDLYSLLENCSLRELMQACEKKYTGINLLMLNNSLVYFKDIDFNAQINYVGREIKWGEVEERLKKAVENPKQVFGKDRERAKFLLEKKRTRGEGKGKGRSI